MVPRKLKKGGRMGEGKERAIEHTELDKERLAAWRRYCSSPTDENKEEYYRVQGEWRKERGYDDKPS